MVGLLDIAPLAETLTIRGAELDVRGIGVGGIAYLMQRYPQIGAAFSTPSTNAMALVEQIGPAAIGAVIACALGHRGDAKYERAAAENLTFEEQVDVIAAAIRMTAPAGIYPFVERIARMAGVELGAPLPGKAPDTTSPSPSSD